MIVKRIISPIITVGLAALLAACTAVSAAGPGTGAAALATPAPAAKVGATAQAFVYPLHSVDLAFKLGGRLSQVLAKEGDSVQAGQTLLRLDDTELQSSVAQAQAALTQAQAQLASVQAGPTEAQIAQAKAGVARAEAALAQAKAGATREQVAVAQARVTTLQAQLANAQAGTRPESIQASADTLLQAEAAVRVAQANYDKVAGQPDVGASPQALALQDATLRLDAAKANHEALLHGSTPGDLAILRSQLAEGQAALAQAKASSTPEQIAQATASLQEAQANLAGVTAGSTPQQIAVAQAGVTVAQAALDQARAALANAELKAPFAGTIGAMNLEPGQYVAPGAPLLTLADLSAWKLETDNLTEADVVHVAVGQAVKISADALPGETFDGTVTRIKPRSETKAGDVTYTVEIALAQMYPHLRWGMTTSVQFPAGQ